jgi:hypothetical protein
VSVDLLPDESGLPDPAHIIGDAISVLERERWDMIIAFPPCTDLSVACANLWKTKQADGRQQAAAKFFLRFIEADCPRIAVENPVGYMNSHFRKPDQIINPYQFGDPWKKRTCLWLKGIDPLQTTNLVAPIGYWVDGGSFKRGHNPASKGMLRGPKSPHKRSKTFPGIAEAMASQWG